MQLYSSRREMTDFFKKIDFLLQVNISSEITSVQKLLGQKLEEKKSTRTIGFQMLTRSAVMGMIWSN